MTKNYTFLLILGFALLFTACQKESIKPAVQNEIIGSEITQKVVFQYSHMNQVTNEQYGWLINNNGEIKSYRVSIDNICIPSEQACQADELESLNQIGTNLALNIEKSELKHYFKLIEKASLGDLSTIQHDPTQTSTTAFYAYKEGLGLDKDKSDDSVYSSNQLTSYTRVLLDMTGSSSQTNMDTTAKDILEWLKAMEENIDL